MKKLPRKRPLGTPFAGALRSALGKMGFQDGTELTGLDRMESRSIASVMPVHSASTVLPKFSNMEETPK